MAEIERADSETEREALEELLATDRGQALRERAAARARDIWDEPADVG